MNWKDAKGSCHGIILGSAPGLSGRTWEKPRKSKNIWPPGRNLNPGPPEYETRVLTTLPQRSLCCAVDISKILKKTTFPPLKDNKDLAFPQCNQP
jgi:hypothetical protein